MPNEDVPRDEAVAATEINLKATLRNADHPACCSWPLPTVSYLPSYRLLSFYILR